MYWGMLAAVAVCCINLGTGGPVDQSTVILERLDTLPDITLMQGKDHVFAQIIDRGKTIDVEDLCFYYPNDEDLRVNGRWMGVPELRMFPCERSGVAKKLITNNTISIQVLENKDTKTRRVSNPDPDVDRKGEFAVLLVTEKDALGKEKKEKFYMRSDVILSYRDSNDKSLEKVRVFEVDKIIIKKVEQDKGLAR
jgi:hypothetical protein